MYDFSLVIYYFLYVFINKKPINTYVKARFNKNKDKSKSKMIKQKDTFKNICIYIHIYINIYIHVRNI